MEATTPTPAAVPAHVLQTRLDEADQRLIGAQAVALAGMTGEDLVLELGECDAQLVAAVRSRDAELVGRVVLSVMDAWAHRVGQHMEFGWEAFGSVDAKRAAERVLGQAKQLKADREALHDVLRRMATMPGDAMSFERQAEMQGLRSDASAVLAKARAEVQ